MSERKTVPDTSDVRVRGRYEVSASLSIDSTLVRHRHCRVVLNRPVGFHDCRIKRIRAVQIDMGIPKAIAIYFMRGQSEALHSFHREVLSKDVASLETWMRKVE